MKIRRVLILFLIFIITTFKTSNSEVNYKFKATSKQGIAAKIGDRVISTDEINKGLEVQIFEAESTIHSLKMDRLKAIILEHLVANHPEKKKLSNDQFFDKYIEKGERPSEKEINAFIAKRNIPAKHVTKDLIERVKNFLQLEIKKRSIEKWLAQQTNTNPIEVYLSRPTPPTFKINTKSAPTKGNAKSKISLVIFSDFECYYCHEAANVIEELSKKYKNEINIIYKHFPLPGHSNARKAALASMCAYEQGSKYFWKLHDELFASQNNLGDQKLLSLAKKIKLKNFNQFSKCLKSRKYSKLIEKDINEGMEIGVNGTPSIYLNGRRVKNPISVELFSELIKLKI